MTHHGEIRGWLSEALQQRMLADPKISGLSGSEIEHELRVELNGETYYIDIRKKA